MVPFHVRPMPPQPWSGWLPTARVWRGGLGAWVLAMLIGGELLLALGSTKKVAQPRSGA